MEIRRTARNPIQKRTFAVFAVLFLVIIGCVFSGFYLTGTSFIWEKDGLTQHYLPFDDYLEKLRQFIREEGFSLWDWNIGMGSDVLTSYGYYVIGDPFVYLGLLFPKEYTELAYHFTILVRLWCIGAGFLFYARKM